MERKHLTALVFGLMVFAAFACAAAYLSAYLEALRG